MALNKIGEVKNNFNKLRDKKNHIVNNHITGISTKRQKKLVLERFLPQHSVENKPQSKYSVYNDDELKTNFHRDKMVENDKFYLENEEERGFQNPV